ncbi:MAG: MBL fold metallo-hydrolase [Calditrichaceae bacterium]|nr:MBL fold metallo-hydrolase [Calditrichaceae bacterium]MBN2708613.1 MBL fold metallo-hydrolase [Calditrichaceae bacterium]RQV95464.1 MAG: MBL fold metallo-hydrolase [Calditrichota bacterium]
MKMDLNKVLYVNLSLVFLLSFACFAQNSSTDENKKPEIKGRINVSQIADKVWCIDNYGVDNMYLIEGNDKALLIDTGRGIADLAGFIKTLTHLPVMVVNTHGHLDHAGGNFQFSQVYAHPEDFEMVKQSMGAESRKRAAQNIKAHDSEAIFAFIDSTAKRPLPSLLPVQEGYIFDLGGRKLEVVETPGHTKGSIVLLDAGNRLLFGGDNNGEMVWLFLDDCLPVESYLHNLQKLNTRRDEFDTILPGHGGPLDKSIIDDQIVCALMIINGDCKGEVYETFTGAQRICRYKKANIAFNPDNIHIKP